MDYYEVGMGEKRGHLIRISERSYKPVEVSFS